MYHLTQSSMGNRVLNLGDFVFLYRGILILESENLASLGGQIWCKIA